MVLNFMRRCFGKAKRIHSKIWAIIFPEQLRLRVLGYLSKSEILSSVVAICSGWFGREARSVLRGQLEHHAQREISDKDSLDGAVYTLRRNIHRLEKGLIMRPRRSTFAAAYIQLTVDVYGTVLGDQTSQCEEDLLYWATDVLGEYFSVVGSEPSIDKARGVYESLDRFATNSGTPRVPYKRPTAPLKITIDDLRELAIRRRSCRWFLQQPVPRQMIDDAIEVAGYAPSACNRQPFEFRIYDNSKTQELASIPLGTKGFSDNFPCLVLIVGTHSAFPFTRDRHVPYIDSCLAAMGFQFALEVQGLSSCCINWPDIPARETALRKLIELEDHEFVVMCMAVGYPDPEGMVPYSQKKSLKLVRSYNKGFKC